MEGVKALGLLSHLSYLHRKQVGPKHQKQVCIKAKRSGPFVRRDISREGWEVGHTLSPPCSLGFYLLHSTEKLLPRVYIDGLSNG